MSGSGALEQYSREQNMVMTCLADVTPSAPRFFWYPYLRQGNINLLRGIGGTGKTSFVNTLIAAITTAKMPSGMPGQLSVDGPRTVCYFGREDNLPEYRYALDRAGADASRIMMVGNLNVSLGDFSLLEKIIKAHKAAIVIFDPVQAFLLANVDMNAKNEIRPILDGIGSIAEKTDTAILMLEHLNKSTKVSNELRGSGSQDFYDRARSVLISGYSPDGSERAIGHLKSNGGPLGAGIVFHIEAGSFVFDYTDASLEGVDILTTRPRRRVSQQGDLYVELAMALTAETGNWMGTPQQAVGQALQHGITAQLSAVAFGKRMRSGTVRGLKVTEGARRGGRTLILERVQGDGGYQGNL